MLKILFDRYLRAGFLWAGFPDAGLPGVGLPGVGLPGVGIDFFNSPLSSQKRIVAVIAVACAVFQASAILGFAQEVAQGPEQIAKWVAELGSPKFEIRDQATGRLSGLSTDQLELLQTMQGNANDPEVRVRLGSVIAKLKSERQQQIIGVFLRDPTMQEDHGLKGWNSFAKVAGATRSSKRLFLQLYERHAELVEQEIIDSDQGAEIARKLVSRIQESEIRRGDGADKSDGLALLYTVCVSEGDKKTPLNASALRLLLRAPFNQALRDPQSKRSIEAMMERWTTTLDDGYEQTVAIQIMVEADLNSARLLSRRMLERAAAGSEIEPGDLLRAFQVFFRRGKPEDIELLEAWLERKEVCEESMSIGGAFAPGGQIPGNRGGADGGAPAEADARLVSTVELRDVALLACMQVRGIDYRQYFPTILISQLWGYIPRSIALPPSSEKVRETRLEAYRNLVLKSGAGQ
jgi:hypothetical protein